MSAQTKKARIDELSRNCPPCFVGPIRSIDDLRAVLQRELWAVKMTSLIGPDGDTGYLRGKRSELRSLLERIDWPDNCVRCGKSPVCDTIDGDALCQNCCDGWALNELPDEELNAILADSGR